ncbi:isoprenylcysteine carboxylmethyltransferase family protein [bacterium]|nr:MAG: isoprenylcysteine carboxylmethyltransferase family protein [bacterium]
MSHRDEGGRGERWVLAQTALFVLYVLLPGQRPVWRSPGMLLAALGAAAAVAGALQLGRSLTPFPEPAQHGQLVESGIYAWVRHPIYAGVLLAAFGGAWATHSAGRALLSVALSLFFDAKTRAEERRLARRFEGYAGYAGRVRKFIPWLY